MCRALARSFVPVLGLALIAVEAAAQAPSPQPPSPRVLKPLGFSARAVVLPARSIGSTVVRAASALAVTIEVQVEDYLPQGLEPTLLIDGAPAPGPSGVVGVRDRVTTLGFVVDRAVLLRDGATLSLQMGEDLRTRVQIPGALRLEGIRPLDQAETQRWGVPTLAEWLRTPR